jgi:hypothetical protein
MGMGTGDGNGMGTGDGNGMGNGKGKGPNTGASSDSENHAMGTPVVLTVAFAAILLVVFAVVFTRRKMIQHKAERAAGGIYDSRAGAITNPIYSGTPTFGTTHFSTRSNSFTPSDGPATYEVPSATAGTTASTGAPVYDELESDTAGATAGFDYAASTTAVHEPPVYAEAPAYEAIAGEVHPTSAGDEIGV